jgi:hypothetical protein
MSKTSLKAVSIATGHDKAILSNGQKTFNNLIKQIEKRRDRLKKWEAVMPAFQKKFVDTLLPLERTAADLRTKIVYRLDEACDEKGLTKSERRTISELIASLAAELLGGSDDAQLKAVYNRHSQSDYDTETAAAAEEMKSVMEEMLGFELGDDIDMNSWDDVLQRAQAGMEAQMAREAAAHQAREEQRAKRKKSPKQQAAQARQEAEQAQLSQAIRDVYRKLASALHPDREADPQERDRKTALMQRVNQAYGKNDLLKLLELQLELEHIDQSAINGISEDRLKRYNQILKEQVAELDQEIRHVEAGFKDTYDIPPHASVSPGTVLRDLANDIALVRLGISEMEGDLRAFDDVKKLKQWVKDLKRQRADVDFDGMPF